MGIDVKSLAKLLADRYGHGMSEKCETQAEVILEVVGERIKELEAQNKKLLSDVQFMVEKAADASLPAYREQGKKIAELEAHCGQLIIGMLAACVNSCSCCTKTNEAQYHDTDCKYRLLMNMVEQSPSHSLAHIQREAI